MRLVITGGGTGGHLFPGIALAQGMQEKEASTEMLFIGTDRHLDIHILERLGIEAHALHCSGIKGGTLFSKLKSLTRLPLAVYQAMRVLRAFAPDLVFGVGGYVTGPVVLAARLLGIPVCLHEQNSVPGLANRLAGTFAQKICISLPCQPPFPAHKTVLTGNPVRREILALAEKTAKKDLTQSSDPFTLVVLGGSQGAHAINRMMVQICQLLREQGQNIHIIHQTGSQDQEMVQQAYAAMGQSAEVQAFFDDMVQVYEQGDLIVSRAGATTLAELSVLGLPALLIPFPFAADNHQETNAMHYVEAGGAKMFLQQTMQADMLAEAVLSLLNDAGQRMEMAQAMRKKGKPQATESIVALCLDMIQAQG